MWLNSVQDFTITLVVSIISLAVAIWAIKISLKGNSLLMTLTKYIQATESKSRAKKSGSNNIAETTKQKEIQIKERAEQRKALELELKKQQQEWKRKKDVAKLIGWFLDRLESDDD